MKGFLTSGELMEAVRALDYMAQYKVCEAFYKLSKGFDWIDRLMFQRFEESFVMIDAENLEELWKQWLDETTKGFKEVLRREGRIS